MHLTNMFPESEKMTMRKENFQIICQSKIQPKNGVLPSFFFIGALSLTMQYLLYRLKYPLISKEYLPININVIEHAMVIFLSIDNTLVDILRKIFSNSGLQKQLSIACEVQ